MIWQRSSQWKACWGSPIYLAVPYLACLSTQKTEDVSLKMSAKCCQGSGGGGSSSSTSSHSSSGASLQHAKEQLPKYQVKPSLPNQMPVGLKSFTVISPQGIIAAGGFYSRDMSISIPQCALKCVLSVLFSHFGFSLSIKTVSKSRWSSIIYEFYIITMNEEDILQMR